MSGSNRMLVAVTMLVAALVVAPSDSFSASQRKKQKERFEARTSDKKPRTSRVGLKVGNLGSGTVSVEGFSDEKSDVGPTFGGFYDCPISGKLLGGVSANMHGLRKKVGATTYSERLIEAAFHLKLSFKSRGGRFVLQPGVGVGLGYLNEGAGGFNIPEVWLKTRHLSIEGIWFIGPGFGVVADIGYAWGNATVSSDIAGLMPNSYSVSAGPMPLMRVGIVF